MRFEFATAGRILFGPGTIKQVGTLAAELGRRALVATGWPVERMRVLTDLLQSAGVQAELLPVVGEPTTELVQAGTARARAAGCDLLIGFGGGSAVDTAKAIAALLTNGGEPFDYLEVIGKG